jgi:hypothetical protein
MSIVKNDGQKWASRSAAASSDYGAGVAAPRRPWAASAAAAADTHKLATEQALADGRYAKGVNKAGDAAWQAGVNNKGKGRYASGVSVAANKYQTNFAPFAAAISSANLPPRGPKGTNYQRVQAIGDVLLAAKKSQ